MKLWDLATGEALRTFEGHEYGVTSVAFSPDGRTALSGSGSWDNTLKLWDVATGEALLTLDGRHTDDVLSVAFSPDGRTALSGSWDNTMKLWDLATGQTLRTFAGHTGGVPSVAFSPDGRTALSGSYDDTLKLWDVATGEVLRTFEGHEYSVLSVAFSPDGRTALSGSEDGTMKLWDMATGKELVTLVAVGTEGDWVAVDPQGRFDGTPRGMEEALHFVSGFEVIELSQLKDRYYEPGLIQKHLGFSSEPLRDVQGFNKVDLTPEIWLAELSPARPTLQIKLTDRGGGGIGRVPIYINGREAFADARTFAQVPLAAGQTELTLSVDLTKSELWLPGRPNQVEVKAYNGAEYILSRGVQAKILTPQDLDLDLDIPAEAAYQPRFFAVVVGVSNYANPSYNLTYSAKDAEDMAAALRLGAEKLFGAERVDIQLLASGTDRPPRRADIVAAFEHVIAQAGPDDIFVVYLSGHGQSGSGDAADFYFLTQEARSLDVSDPILRDEGTLTSGFLTEMSKRLKAQKYVLILDACHSGQVVENLLASKNIPGNTLRALDRMRDRTGSFILTGCAADALSFEASRFGQGILTYTLLSGMKGAALRENAFVDILQLFSFAQEQVPQLAGEVGGIQRPQVFSPDGGKSFDIGKIEAQESAQIVISNPKPIFLRSSFTNADEAIGYDDLELTTRVDQALHEVAAIGKGAPLVFYDVRDFPQAYFMTGRYRKEADGYALVVTVRDAETKQAAASFEVRGTTAATLGEAILRQLPALGLK